MYTYVSGGGVGSNSLSAQALQLTQNIQATNPQASTSLLYPPDMVEISAENLIKTKKNTKKKSLSTTAKSLWGAGLATIAGLGIWLATKGKVKPQPLTEAQAKKLEELISSGKINKEYAEIFKNMNGLEIDQWFSSTYRDIAKSMGYRFKYDIPELIVSTKEATGGKGGLTKITINMQDGTSTDSILGTMRHELEHFRQSDLVFRSFGEEEFINAQILPMLNKIKYNEASCIKQTGKKYSELTNADIETYKENARKMLKEKCYKLRSLLERKGKIEVGTEQYKEAEQYLQAMKNYETIYVYEENLTAEAIKEMKKTNPERFKFLQEALKRYENNPLEIGAYREGNKFRNMYNLFCNEVLNIK